MSPQYRWPVVVAALVLLAAGRLRSLSPGAVLATLALCAVVVAGGIVGGRALARHRLANLPDGALWACSALLPTGDLVAGERLGGAAPKRGLRSALLAPEGLVPGLLVFEHERVRWEPQWPARLAGASRWELPRAEVVAVEVGRRGRIPGISRPWLRLWLSNRSSVAAHVVTTQGLQPALDRLGLGSRRVAPS